MTRFRFESSELGTFTVDDETVEVIGPGGVSEVEPQVFGVLLYLVEQQGRLVTKEELLDNVWGDRFVSESALTTRIKQARRAIDDDGTTQWAIKTVHGRGYRFLPEVAVDTGTSESPGIEPPPAEHDAPASIGAPPPAPGQPADGDRSAAPRLVVVPTAESALPDELEVDVRRAFCGRRDELGRAVDVLDRAGSGTFGWIWILGEPGIGKTRLAAEVARRARDREQRVVFGRNDEDLRVPYQPFIEVLRRHGGDPATMRAARPELAPLLPQSSAAGDDAALRHESVIDSDTRRYRMYEAVAEWLDELAASVPTTMIVDDVHWAAESTLQLLSHLQRRQHGGPVTFVLTSRDTAPDVNTRVSDLVGAGPGDASSVVIRLAGLSEADAVELVGDRIGPGLDIADVMRQTAGNPLFLQAVDDTDGSVDMQSAVRRRLASLGDGVQESLRTASVLGLEFELRVAAATMDRSELDLLEDLELAVAARLLDDVGQDRFRFAHALVRSSLRGELSSSRRARMHRRASIAIHEVFGDDRRHLPELAFHTAEAALVDRQLRPVAIERLEQAAHESSVQFSFEEAAELLRRARSLAGTDDVALAARLALRQGVAETRAGRNIPAAHTFETLVELAGETGDVELRVEAAIRYEDATWRPGLPGTKALRYLRAAASLLDDAVANGFTASNELELRARVAVATLRALAMSGRRDEVADAFEHALELATELQSPTVEANVIGVYLGQVLFYERVEEAEPMVRRLAELLPLIDDGDVALHAVHDQIHHATLTGRFDERRRLVPMMSDLQERSHSRFWAFIRANQEAMEAFYEGDLELAERLAERCLALADDLPEEDGGGTFGLRMFLIRREQDRLHAIAPLLRRVLADADEGAIWTPGLALLLAETDALDEAAEALEPVKARGFDLPIDAMWSTVMVLLIETMVKLGDRDACAVLRDRFGSQAGMNVTTGSGLMCFGRAERYLGMLSFVLGDLETAERHLATALEADDRGGSVLWRNESRLWLARVRRAQGHAAEADAMLAVVAREAREAGLRRLVRLAGGE